jgi:hypothetical protein
LQFCVVFSALIRIVFFCLCRVKESIPGATPLSLVTWGGQATLGSFQLGQSLDTLVTLSVPAGTPVNGGSISVTARYRATSSSHDTDSIVLSGIFSDSGDMEIDYHIWRCRFIDCLNSAVDFMSVEPPNMAGAQNAVRNLLEEMRGWLDTHTDTFDAQRPMNPQDHHQSAYRKIKFLSDDLGGQVTHVSYSVLVI